MKKTIFILSIFFLSLNGFAQDNNKLYPVYEHGQWGYINRHGVMVIEPRFLAAGQFAEGLACVREGGTYGYIDTEGSFVISPKYDLAEPFRYGLAKVYLDGRPFFIDKEERMLFKPVYKDITGFGSHSFAVVISDRDKYGLINREGKLLLDTVFERINPFVDGLAIVRGTGHMPYPEDDKDPLYEMGVIDSTGNWIIPFGRYKSINDYKNGYAKAELITSGNDAEERPDREAFVDKTGKERFKVPATKYDLDYNSEGFYDDLAVVAIYSIDVTKKKTRSSGERTNFMGAIDPDGNIVFSNPDWTRLTPFNFNRAFAKDIHDNWRMIDRAGKPVGSTVFEEILYDDYKADPKNLFTDGKAFVRSAGGWIAIDTNGTILTKPMNAEKIDYGRLLRRGDMIYLQEDISTEHKGYSYWFGFWNTKNNTIVEPGYYVIDMNSPEENLIYTMRDGKMGYITRSGKTIWEQEDSDEETSYLNIDHMNRGYFYASSEYKKELAGYGGWGGSKNSPKTVPGVKKKASGQSLQLFIDIAKETKWADKYEGIKLFVTNHSNDTLFFNAQDSRLYLKLQALDKQGNWKDIEYLPSSWCGNSYHTLFLAANEQWDFDMPVYQGEFRTKIRAQLLYKRTSDQEKSDIIYSNGIDGYINPGQFWNKRPYSPGGIMDPYND